MLGLLGEEGFVHQADGQWNWTHESYPADAVSLRSVSSDNVVVIDVTVDPQVIAETDFTSAPSMLHEKAIYILEGQLFHVERFDFDHRKAYVKRVDCDYYTDAIKYSKVTILDERTPAVDDASGLVRRSLAEAERTVRSTSCPASSASRRSASTPTRTSARASSTCPSSRCTRRRTG